MVGDTILINDISINGNDELKNASDLSKKLTDNTINALGVDASSRTIWVNGQPYGNAYVNVNEDDTIEKPIGGEIFNDFANNVASGEYSHAEGQDTAATNHGAHAEGLRSISEGVASHAEGVDTKASGNASHAEGQKTVTTNKAEHAEGKYNVSIKDKTIHTVGIGEGTSETDRKNAHEIHLDGKHYIYGIGGYDGTNSENVRVKTVQAVVNESINQVTISYLKLKELRDASQLVPGKEYRINDYTCTTTQTGTRSAGNDFDIIVTADSESTLNEEARAINHEFDNPEQDHFKDCNLAAWKLWYCLDNDTNRFAWADTNTNADNNENGKGVIYRMIDEFNNECPYDFKNIQFYRAWDDSLVSWSIIPDDTITTSIKPCYTFSSAEYGSITSSTTEFIDASLKESNRVYSNIIKSFTKAVWPVRQKQFLNNNCLFYTNTYSNTLGTNCYNNTFIDCSFNILENGCYNNLLNRGIYNTLKTYCYNNVLHNNSSYNTLGNNCYNNRIDCGNYNRFGDDCYDNALINDCNTNTFGNSCYSNNFLDDCTQNYFGNGCYENSFSFRAVNNSFGNNCYNNTFGQDCSDNALGNNCNNNAFGDNCSNSAFGNSCNNIKFGTISSTGVTYTYDYYQNNHFGDNCQYIVFKGEERASQTAQVQNYNFAQGLQGTETEYLSIDGKRGREYDTYISLDTNNAIKESVIADKLDKMIEISYKKLYDLRKASGLIPGQQYRITDYICTTDPNDTSIRAQQNKFDIIVTADNETTLNEEARAIRNDNDNNYFKDCDLNAWKLWYCLDNDTNRFAWADATETDGNPNGKGVIYRMIDEWNNDIPYDFKNIQFKRYAVTDITSTTLTRDALNDLKNILVNDSNGGLYFATKDSYEHFVPSDVDSTSYIIDENDFNWYYTFQGIGSGDGSIINKMYDLTVETFKLTDECISFLKNNGSGADTEDYCRENKIEQFNQEYFTNGIYYKGRQILNNIVFIGGLNYCYQNKDSWEYKTSSIYGNRFGMNCNSNTFGNNCQYNTFGNRFEANTAVNYFRYNIFGRICGSNTFGNNCYNNTFGNECHHNTVGSDCDSNTFGNYYYRNTLGNRCKYNIFGNNCYSNTLGNNCYSNTFGNDCDNNTFRDSCSDNSFGNGCDNNTFGGICSDNSFGNYCQYIKFASDINATTEYAYYHQNHFGDGCQRIVFKQDKDPDSTNFKYVQNYTFAQGFNNHRINGERGREYDTYISLNTDGTLKESVIANKLDKMIEITYKELYDLREESRLIPGQQYRITDYTCTTTQVGTASAGHDFDIIVTADSKNKLNEEARAIQHTDDENDYFDKYNLSAWKIWYCLDNDMNRFDWANSRKDDENNPNGRGVIYRMIDDFGNDCPYDFKNIQFFRVWNSSRALWSTISSSAAGTKPCYTFSSRKTELDITDDADTSLLSSNYVYSNIIKPYIKDGKQVLNNICFFGSNCNTNVFMNNCYNNSIGNNCNSNTFGNECNTTTIGDHCYRNTFGSVCYNNALRRTCVNNTFKNECNNIIFDEGCLGNTFGEWCTDIKLCKGCTYNSFGNSCQNIRFNKYGNIPNKVTYYAYNHFGDGCEMISFNCKDETITSSSLVQNYNFANGLKSYTSGSYLNIPGKSNSYDITISRGSDGKLYEYCLAGVLAGTSIVNDLTDVQPK